MNKTTTIIIGIVLIVAAFFIGHSTGVASVKATASQAGTGAYAGFSRTGGAGREAGGGGTIGQIVSVDATTITVSIPNNGGSKVILYSPTTAILKTAAGTPSDLTVGANVSVAGTANSDGSITATSIQIRPTFSGNPNLLNQRTNPGGPMIPATQ